MLMAPARFGMTVALGSPSETGCHAFVETAGCLSHVLWHVVWRNINSTIITIIVGSTALGGLWSPQTNVASTLCPGNPHAIFYNPVSLRLPLLRQSFLISVGHVLVDSRVWQAIIVILHQHVSHRILFSTCSSMCLSSGVAIFPHKCR